MNFLKKHYEKLLMAVLFLVFISLLFYLLTVIRSTGEVTVKDLNIPTRAPDYEQAKVEDVRFELGKKFSADTWGISQSRDDAKAVVFTDLVAPMAIARCPHCQYFIPLHYFNDLPCPNSLCGKKLPKPPKRATGSGRITANDWDGDGIPNDVEVQAELDPKNPDDALDDLDEDGFSNLYEYLQKTEINSAKSHPPFYHRLYISARRPVELDVIVKKVIAGGPEKAQWEIQFNRQVKDAGGKVSEKTEYSSLGGTVRLDNRDYTIVDIERKERNVTSGATTVTRDESIVTLKSVEGGQEVKMKVDTVALSPRSKIVLTDVSTGNEFLVDVGETFRMGNRKTGTSRYQVESVDVDKMTLKLRDITDRKTRRLPPIDITRQCRIPAAQRIRVVPGERRGAREGAPSEPDNNKK